MKTIDLNSWNRKSHFEFFKQFDNQHFTVSINEDVRNIYQFAKSNKISFFLITLYAILKASNQIKEFKQRVEGDKIVEYDSLACSSPIMTKENLYKSVILDYFPTFEEFSSVAKPIIDSAKNSTPSEKGVETSKNDLIIASCNPWFSFTSINAACLSFKSCSIPVITWGKAFEENNKFQVPISMQLNHLFVDGIHIGQYVNLLQKYFNAPEEL